jgi:CBS domain-containing protein
MRAIEAATRPARSVDADTPLQEVAGIMAGDGVRAIVVLDSDGKPAGIVTERDLVVRGLARNLAPGTAVSSVMTAELITTEPTVATRVAYRLLGVYAIRQIPLVESGRLVGIVDRDDLADEATAEAMAALGPCPRCDGQWLRPVSTAEATNFLCLWCRTCWHLENGTFVPVETRTCRGCPDHNFCRFPLMDYGVDLRRRPTLVFGSANATWEPEPCPISRT